MISCFQGLSSILHNSEPSITLVSWSTFSLLCYWQAAMTAGKQRGRCRDDIQRICDGMHVWSSESQTAEKGMPLEVRRLVTVWIFIQVMQYPSEEAMRKRIRDHNTWKSFKHSMVNQVKSRQIHWCNHKICVFNSCNFDQIEMFWLARSRNVVQASLFLYFSAQPF